MASVRASFSLDQAVPGTDGKLTFHDVISGHPHKPKWSRHLPRTNDRPIKQRTERPVVPATDGLLVLLRVVLPKSLNLKGAHVVYAQGRSVDEAVNAFRANYPLLPYSGTRKDDGVSAGVHNWTLRVKAPAKREDALVSFLRGK